MRSSQCLHFDFLSFHCHLGFLDGVPIDRGPHKSRTIKNQCHWRSCKFLNPALFLIPGKHMQSRCWLSDLFNWHQKHENNRNSGWLMIIHQSWNMVQAIWGWLTILTIIYLHFSKQIAFFIDLWLTPAVHLQSCHQNFGFLSPFNGHQSRSIQRCLSPWSPWSITGSGGHATKSIVAKKMSWTWTSAAMATLALKWDLDSGTAAQHIMGSADMYNKNICVSDGGMETPEAVLVETPWRKGTFIDQVIRSAAWYRWRCLVVLQ